MPDSCAKLRLLLWKNWKMTARHPCNLALLIIIPLCGASLLVALKQLLGSGHSKEESHEAIKPLELLTQTSSSAFMVRADNAKFAWTAKGNTDFRDTARRVMSILYQFGLETSEFETEEKLTNYIEIPHNMKQEGDAPFTMCGIIFENPSGAQSFCAPALKMKVRFPGMMRGLLKPWATEQSFPSDKKPEAIKDNPYIQEMFLHVQSVISNSIINECGEKSLAASVSQISVRQFPTPDHYDPEVFNSLNDLVAFIIVISFLLPFTSTIKLITTEKEYQLKESMKIMGLPNVLHWSAWFIRTIIIFLIISWLMAILFKLKVKGTAIFNQTSLLIILIFLFLYSMVTTFLCFLVSVIFNKAQFAAIIGALIWLITYLPWQVVVKQFDNIDLGAKLVISLFPNLALVMGLHLIIVGEITDSPVACNNLFRQSDTEMLTLGLIFLMLLFEGALFMLLTLYIESVIPGSFGVPLPWYFIFQKSYWRKDTETMDESDMPRESYRINPKNFEEEPLNLRAGIKLKGLRKVFPKGRVAVSDFSLQMYEGQVTVLLGHNGAGKTTTMNMLTGMYRPTSGVAILNDHDVMKATTLARESLGICLQHNVLFAELTVREHLYFFAKMKGVSKEKLPEEIDKYIELLDLESKKNCQSKVLSGGQKRRLAIGIALCGDSKVVLLDEPTAGVDTAARHMFWNIIRLEKENRTILLSTHIMDEADVLGDRIAIMANGRLMCCGSPFFLKKLFSSGYRLMIEKAPNCDSRSVTNLLQMYVPEAVLLQEVKTELTYQLNDQAVNRFEDMLDALERNSETLNVISFGLSATTMGDVFINTVEVDQGVSIPNPEETRQKMIREELVNCKVQTGSKLYRSRLSAMCYKRQVLFRGSLLTYILTCFIPIVFYLMIQALLFTSRRSTSNPPPLVLDLEAYENPVTTVLIAKSFEKSEDPESIFWNDMYKVYKDNAYKQGSEVNDLGYQDNPSFAFENYILEKIKEDKKRSYRKFIVAASFETSVYTGWYTNYAIHSLAITYNLLINAAMTKIPMSLDVENYPLPLTQEDKVDLKDDESAVRDSLALSLAFLAGYFILLPTRERASKSKHLQFVSGVRGEVFWAVHFLWSFMLYIPPCVLFITVVAMFQDPGFSTGHEIGRLLFLLLLFGWAMIPIMYIIALWFSEPTSAYITIIMFVFMSGILHLILLILKDASKDEWRKKLYECGLILPPFCFFDALLLMMKNNDVLRGCEDRRKVCSSVEIDPCCPGKCPSYGCVKFTDNYFQIELPGIGENILFLALPTLFYFCLLIFIEYYRQCVYDTTKHCKKNNKIRNVPDDSQLDPDVLEEKRLILSYGDDQLTERYTLCLRNVSKRFKKYVAVDHLCIGVEKGECFGLLGANGAGKTTTFKIMTGDLMRYDGEAFILGTSINNQRKVFGCIGYCPQFDALLENMTGRETLRLYCLLRGVPKNQINKTIQGMAEVLLFTEFLGKKVKTYSGGTKRKLSTAITMIGCPKVIFLDEPTAGMDPVARKYVWSVLSAVRDSGTSIVLTSHSMDECEAICTKIVIMVNGQFKCLGSLQHLKNKLTQGFVLQIKLPSTGRKSRKEKMQDDNTKEVKEFISGNFPGAELRDELSNFLVYLIPKGTLKFSTMFGLMEKGKKEVNIEDYTLTQTDLEQVFLTLIKQQVSSDNTV